MMHDREKSDSAIVAGKPTNKAGQPAAESVEPRAEAEGNASRQSTHRTQDRERVSQALERVRQAAKQRKKERFTALLHHVNIDLLRTAVLALKRDAAPGVDGVTWRTYEADLDRNLTDLHSRVHREHIGRCHHVGHTYRRQMGDSAPWRWRRLRTRSFRERPLRY